MPRKAVLTEEERKQHQREAMKRWREKQKAKPKQQKPKKNLFPPPEEHDFATEKADPATIAAWINERHGFSEILGEYRRGSRTIIAERLKHTDFDSACYRLKETRYVFFSSRAELQTYAEKNRIKLRYN